MLSFGWSGHNRCSFCFLVENVNVWTAVLNSICLWLNWFEHKIHLTRALWRFIRWITCGVASPRLPHQFSQNSNENVHSYFYQRVLFFFHVLFWFCLAKNKTRVYSELFLPVFFFRNSSKVFAFVFVQPFW